VSEVLAKSEVEQWLAGLPPETEVGRAGCPGDCPLARYLQAHGYPQAEVLGPEWGDGAWGPWHQSPPWAEGFAETIDCDWEHEPVTAAAALAVLRSLEPAEAVLA